MTPFEPDGVCNSIPYRVLRDRSIEAMMPGGLVRFKNIQQLVASTASVAANTNVTHSTLSNGVPDHMNERNGNVPAPARPLDYYSILLEAIKRTRQNSAQLRALVYERARFNLKRDVLFGYSSMGLADVVRQVHEFELAVARIEANATDDEPDQAHREQEEPRDTAQAKPRNAVQILPPKPVPPLYAGLKALQRTDSAQFARLSEQFVRHVRSTNKFIGVALLGMAIIGTVIITMLWPSLKLSSQTGVTSKLSQSGETAVTHGTPGDDGAAPADSSAKVPFPLPAAFGIYVLSNDKLTELKPLPIGIPDPRIALSAEIDQPSSTTISDDKPAFILFRRDLLNNAPKVTLRVIARMARETKIVDGKAGTTNIEGAWRIRNISLDLKLSPVPGQREMLIARVDDTVSLTAGRYALVLNRTGYDFAIAGAVQSPAFCLEKFETANGQVFNQCRNP
jgi:hypothetical protein